MIKWLSLSWLFVIGFFVWHGIKVWPYVSVLLDNDFEFLIAYLIGLGWVLSTIFTNVVRFLLEMQKEKRDDRRSNQHHG